MPFALNATTLSMDAEPPLPLPAWVRSALPSCFGVLGFLLSFFTGTAGASGSPRTTDIGWCARFVGWICCASVQNADGHHESGRTDTGNPRIYVTLRLIHFSLPASSAASPSDLDPDPAFSYKSYVLPLQLKEKEETRLSETTQIASYHFAKSLISTTSQDALCLDRSFSLCTAPGCMRQSCALIEKEAEVEEIFVVSCRREGAVHQAYLPIVAASRRAATLHYCCNDREFTTEVLIQSIANGAM
ncbi:uncharacterized protein EDB93DRAFT_1250899 [Suillus bovinus]|uniref:uncharacterized protein n=1 Tax=Suillus bovinus TaxID=48563 RepID=UPI001B875DA3|nr:uncharacterized protein EDB93DRAFT_1257082 [Suillus bovinus]XP_041307330.1 uncharacterized protein EDB93DRAFT_1285305 [Suillus bovinus]XP_041307346.1 uncharacterized protein EDB93DRAFT_1250899 [Suillus bovinus]KAG2127295.1 hypothetical protein EDB93DRAFT_1257082 [Suillus bovinus]KAG2146598.1 hypothetical protein EDB93DRAFT_1285305 [Suillus bovinus]KAG2146614.1 hypothetical protein EDB93DRAFT_1250899 [Suillus bovinus]